MSDREGLLKEFIAALNTGEMRIEDCLGIKAANPPIPHFNVLSQTKHPPTALSKILYDYTPTKIL
jgi:hypothetical protein